jgi:hypothetical protein
MQKEISEIVSVELEEIIRRDREGFLDLLEESVIAGREESHGVLSDIEYEVVGYKQSNGHISIRVHAVLIQEESN